MRVLMWGSVVICCLIVGCSRSKEVAVPVPEPAGDTQRVTAQGAIVGFHDEENTFAWLGIPYAQAPVGELRWAAPRPPQPWNGVRPAVQTQHICPQIGGASNGASKEQMGKLIGSEDCLYLNVWSPSSTATVSTPLPVMVWIHGGGNSTGSGGSYQPLARILAGRQQVVVVTINYRLGIFGWFHHPALAGANPRDTGFTEADRSGNFGTLDIIQSLHWVRDNIAAFGGDPNNITLFGESAGGFNAYSMLASPLAKGLFHKAISQSGGMRSHTVATAENYRDEVPAGHARSAKEVTVALLLADGTANNRDEAKAWLANRPAADVAAYLRGKSAADCFAQLRGDPALGGLLDLPLVFSDGYVLPTDSPRELLNDPTLLAQRVPLITGANRDEDKLFQFFDPRFTGKWFGVLPRIRDDVEYQRIALHGSNTRRLYATDLPAAALTASAVEPPVFAYRFDFDQLKRSWLLPLDRMLGAAHGLEIAYVFGAPSIDSKAFSFNTDESLPAREKLAYSMSSYWANFAYTGAPDRGRQHDLPQWQPWSNTAGEAKTMVFDADNRGGVRMTDAGQTMATVKQALLTDPSVQGNQAALCATYARVFYKNSLDSSLFDEQEYATLGQGGCGAYPPQDFKPQ